MRTGELNLMSNTFNSLSNVVNATTYLNKTQGKFKTVLDNKISYNKNVERTTKKQLNRENVKNVKLEKKGNSESKKVDANYNQEKRNEVSSKESHQKSENVSKEQKLDSKTEVVEKEQRDESKVTNAKGVETLKLTDEIDLELLEQMSSQIIEILQNDELNDSEKLKMLKSMIGLETLELADLENLFDKFESVMNLDTTNEQKIVEINNILKEFIKLDNKIEAKKDLKLGDNEIQKVVNDEDLNLVDKRQDGTNAEFENVLQKSEVKQNGFKFENRTKQGDNQNQKEQNSDIKTSDVKVSTISDDTKTFAATDKIMEDVKINNIDVKNIVNKAQMDKPFENKIFQQVLKGANMSLNVGKNGSEMMIKLNPKELGNVSLKIILENEQLVAKFNVENQTVKAIVESRLEDLKTALSDKGFNIESLDVSVNKDSDKAFEEFKRFSRKRWNKKSNELTGVETLNPKDTQMYNNMSSLDMNSEELNLLA